MIHVTQRAVEELKAILREHPEEHVARVKVRDQGETKLTFHLTLEEAAEPDDEMQKIDGLAVAVERSSAQRMDGLVIDFQETKGFQFRHPQHQPRLEFNLINLN